ncbi:MAG TPA: hypothetical protein VG734_17885 [Lacunisphaera sp.]|nr:hypothetical protein [Lacunisphaera sp.]
MSAISQPQRRLRDWSRVRSSEQQDISTTRTHEACEPGVGVETDAHQLHDFGLAPFGLEHVEIRRGEWKIRDFAI